MDDRAEFLLSYDTLMNAFTLKPIFDLPWNAWEYEQQVMSGIEMTLTSVITIIKDHQITKHNER